MSKPTKRELARWDLLSGVGCITCLLSTGEKNDQYEIHHILSGGQRLGHWYTLPLCFDHHRNPNHCSIAAGSKVFSAMYGTQLEIWQALQRFLSLDDTLPKSKLVSKRL